MLGILATLLFFLTIIKFIPKRMKWKRADYFLSKSHKITAILFMIVSFMHFISSLALFQTRSLLIYILGSLTIVCMVLVMESYIFRKKLGSKWIVVHRFGTVVMLLFIVSHIAMVVYSLSVYKAAVSHIECKDIDLSIIKDGIYEGEFDVGYIYARVEVNVLKGKIMNITVLEHQNERGTPAEGIIHRMIKEQRIDVDAVSGATNSSKVIKKAVENALTGGINNEN